MLTVKEVLDGKIGLDLRYVDRVLLNGWVRYLQMPGGVVNFIREQHGWPIPSPAAMTKMSGAYPHADAGVEVRRMIFHQLRSHAIEDLNGQFKGICDGGGQVPTRERMATQRYILGAVLVYQLTLLYRFETGGDLRVGLKPLLRAT